MAPKKIIFFFQLGQDLDVLLPAMKHAMERGFRVKVVLKNGLFRASPRMACLKNFPVQIEELPKTYRLYQLFKILRGCSTVVSASETNAGPHREAHKLVKVANFCFKKTVTLQHGYENIGLTYSDDEYPIDQIHVASKIILTWSRDLHANIPERTRRKCRPAGIPKIYDSEIPEQAFKERDYIAVFENLHWGRFSDSYRELFLSMIRELSNNFPETLILVKPHHAGKWLTKRYKGPMPHFPNVVILNPESSEWEPYTAPALIKYAKAVITTPSSVCLDSYLQNKPVAVLQFDLDLPNYKFAKKCRTIDDVLNFIKSPQNGGVGSSEILGHEDFLKTFERVLES